MKNTQPLYNMFQSVPKRYDLLNKILTLKMDNLWRSYAAKECLKERPSKILDLCTGTGDLSIQIMKKVNYPIKITGLDYSSGMLEVAEKKAANYIGDNLELICSDVSEIPFADNYFDTIAISFAFRNLTYKNIHSDKYMKEIYRVLKKDGKFVIIESSQPENKIIKFFYHLYLKNFVSPIGSLLSNHPSAYKYLSHSAMNYFNNKSMKTFLEEHNFNSISFKPYLFGAVTIYVALK